MSAYNGVNTQNMIYNGQAVKTWIHNGVTVFSNKLLSELVDFGYTVNADGTYTITEWKGTADGVSSTELILPDNNSIIL